MIDSCRSTSRCSIKATPAQCAQAVSHGSPRSIQRDLEVDPVTALGPCRVSRTFWSWRVGNHKLPQLLSRHARYLESSPLCPVNCMKEIRPTFGSSASYPQVSQRYMAVDVGLWGQDSTRTSCTSGTTDSCRHMKHPTHSVINYVALESRCHFRAIYHNPFITSIPIHTTNQNGHHDNRGPTRQYAKSRSMLFYKAFDSELLSGRTPLILKKD
jgi:hypothetical protein